MEDDLESEKPGSPVDYVKLGRLLSEGEYEPVTRVYMQVQDTEGRVDAQTVVTLLEDLSRALRLDLSPAASLLSPSSEDTITLEDFQDALRRYCETQQLQRDIESPSSPNLPQPPSQDHQKRAQLSPSPGSNATPRLQSPVMSRVMEQTLKCMQAQKRQIEAALEERDPTVVTRFIVEICRFQVSEDQFQSLTFAIAEAFPLASTDHTPEENYSDLEKVVCIWAESNNISFIETPTEDPLIAKLKVSISEFEQMKAEKESAGEDVEMLENVLKTLKMQLNKVVKDNGADAKSRKLQIFNEKCAKTIKELFKFYSNQLRMLGKTPSFDSIQKNSSTWNISKFVCFCRDFNLLLDKQRQVGVKTLELNTVKQIFIKNSVLQKEMDEGQFDQALSQLAVAYYDLDYEKLTGAQVSDKSEMEKREMMLRFMQFDQTQECLRRAKGFGMPFSSNTDNRIPENDLMKRYKYKPYKGQKAALEEWKMQKTSAPREKPSRGPTPPKRSPVDAIVSYSSGPEENLETTQSKYATKARNPYTWKTLGQLNPEEVMGKDEDFDLNNLIAEDSDDDEILKKQYPLAVSQPVVVEPPKKEKVLKPKFSTPQLVGVKANALIKSESKPNLEQRTKQMLEKGVSEQRLGKGELDKAMRVGEAQRERGYKVLGRLRQSQQFAS